MAGHSHWAGIKHKKGRADKERSKIFSKLSIEITVAAKLGEQLVDLAYPLSMDIGQDPPHQGGSDGPWAAQMTIELSLRHPWGHLGTHAPPWGTP